MARLGYAVVEEMQGTPFENPSLLGILKEGVGS